jgi:hypothetical protein
LIGKLLHICFEMFIAKKMIQKTHCVRLDEVPMLKKLL